MKGHKIMIFKKILLSTFLLTAVIQAESSIGLNINNEDVEISGQIDFNALADYSSGTSYLISGSYLYSGANDHNNGEHLFTVGFSGQNSLPGIEGLTVALGAKAVFSDNFTALPLFVKANYALPLIDTIPMTSLFAGFAYAPSVLTFSDGEDYSEFRIGADMEVISNTHVFVGYRNIDTDYSYGDYNFNDSFYGGLRIAF